MRRARRSGAVALLAFALLLPAPRAGAAILSAPAVSGMCGTAIIGSHPADLRPGMSVDRAVQVIPEKSADSGGLPFGLSTPAPVDIDAPGVYDRPSALPPQQPQVPSNGAVASFLLHWDPPPTAVDTTRRTVTLGFDHALLGLQVFPATLDAPASQQFRADDITYPERESGLELAADGSADSVRVIDAYTVSISFTATAGVKEIRIVTGGAGADQRESAYLSAGPRKQTGYPPSGSGFSMLSGDGGVFVFEPDGGYHGSLGASPLNEPVVGGARTCSGEGYWLVARDGGVFGFGDAAFHGSLADAHLASPVVGMAPTPTGDGYYLATAAGQVAPFGDARFLGDTSGRPLTKPIVGIATTPTGDGYWLVASDGGIFAFGDATFDGSTGGIELNQPIVAMRAAPSGDGYYLLSADGGVFTFSSNQAGRVPVPYFGAGAADADGHAFVGMKLAADGGGYWLIDDAGEVFGYGPSAPSDPGMSGARLSSPIIGSL